MSKSAEIGIIGGTGVYQMDGFQIKDEISVDTPFGSPSSPMVIATIGNQTIAFLARHGIGHTIPPSQINYRANIYAMKKLGVRTIVGVSACGSLREDFEPGDIVIPNQIIDFTKDRKRSFFETGLVAHISSADPFCPHASKLLYDAVVEVGAKVHKGGSMITIEGPRFSTKAESSLFRSWGINIIGMTTSPEVFLAREAEICYATIAHVTDYDVWHTHQEPVSVEMILKLLHKNTQIANQSLLGFIQTYQEGECECQSALASAITTHPEKIDPEMKNKLSIIIQKYIK
jgi:5'-methylthioadenosine phosphorylase